jgi:molybdopterin synthase catalytic subunit
VIHLVGANTTGKAIVLVAKLTAHSADSFEAASALMDYLKTDAPLWKKEAGPDGTHWIEPTPEDRARRAALEKVTS